MCYFKKRGVYEKNVKEFELGGNRDEDGLRGIKVK